MYTSRKDAKNKETCKKHFKQVGVKIAIDILYYRPIYG